MVIIVTFRLAARIGWRRGYDGDGTGYLVYPVIERRIFPALYLLDLIIRHDP